MISFLKLSNALCFSVSREDLFSFFESTAIERSSESTNTANFSCNLNKRIDCSCSWLILIAVKPFSLFGSIKNVCSNFWSPTSNTALYFPVLTLGPNTEENKTLDCAVKPPSATLHGF